MAISATALNSFPKASTRGSKPSRQEVINNLRNNPLGSPEFDNDESNEPSNITNLEAYRATITPQVLVERGNSGFPIEGSKILQFPSESNSEPGNITRIDSHPKFSKTEPTTEDLQREKFIQPLTILPPLGVLSEVPVQKVTKAVEVLGREAVQTYDAAKELIQIIKGPGKEAQKPKDPQAEEKKAKELVARKQALDLIAQEIARNAQQEKQKGLEEVFRATDKPMLTQEDAKMLKLDNIRPDDLAKPYYIALLRVARQDQEKAALLAEQARTVRATYKLKPGQIELRENHSGESQHTAQRAAG